MTISATNVIPPMLTATEIISLFLAGVTAKTIFRGFFRRFVFVRNDLRNISAAIDVRLAWAMTGFTAGNFALPTAESCQLRVRRMRIGFELILVTSLTGFAANVIAGGGLVILA